MNQTQVESRNVEIRQEIRGHAAVRAAAKDFEAYSSDLLGDRDVRSYRQLPLEADPPRHTQFRMALQPLFMSGAIEKHVPAFEKLAQKLIQDITARGHGELTTDLALPYVIGCLTIIYNRPQDFEEWLSWGPDVWTADAYAKGEVTAESIRAHRERSFEHHSQRSGETLHSYLKKAFDAAETDLERDPDKQDVWDTVSQLVIDGEPVTREEMYGMASVLLAGGRDTVIKLVTGFLWHLLRTPADREFLTSNEKAFTPAIAEMVRYLSPLSKMERARGEDVHVPDAERDTDRYVLLSYVSANFDKTVWPDPEVLNIHRERRPHLGFGFGRHSCMGMNIADLETRAFLHTLLKHWPDWVLDGEPEIVCATEGEGDDAVEVIERFVSLPVRVR